MTALNSKFEIKPSVSPLLLQEIQGLRAIAVALIILFHLWPEQLSGGYIGVDIFFVISGFLITSHLLREIDATGSIQLGRFWARRARRLLPAAFFILIVILISTMMFLPVSSWQRVSVEIAASAVYVLNWILTFNALDYFAAGNSATAVQHYWSLSVEEQFYIFWPLIILTLISIALRTKLNTRRVITVGVVTVATLSFGYSIWYSYEAPAAAYFSTFTHAWEFSVGAFIALIDITLGGRKWVRLVDIRAIISWTGIVIIVSCSLFFTGATIFPGWVAVIPVVGAILVIIAGNTNGSRISPMPFLSSRPVQFLGDVSYSAYLWHWPLIVFSPFIIGRALDMQGNVIVLLLTLILAALTKRFVEDPFRSSSSILINQRFTFGFSGVGSIAVVLGSVALWVVLEQRTNIAIAKVELMLTGEEKCFGASAMLLGIECPNRFNVEQDLLLATGFVAEQISKKAGKVPLPSFGMGKTVIYSPGAEITIAIVGDSHADHYSPALVAIAKRNHWNLVRIRHNNCTPSFPSWDSPHQYDMGKKCQKYRQKSLFEKLPLIDEIDVIVTSSVAPRYAKTTTEEVQVQIAESFTKMWAAWTTSGKKVIVIPDVPGPGKAVGEARECVEAHPDVEAPCTAPRTEVLERDAMLVAATSTPLKGLSVLDLTDLYCDVENCHSVIGGLVVYRGGAHISRLFSLSLTPFIEEHIKDILDI